MEGGQGSKMIPRCIFGPLSFLSLGQQSSISSLSSHFWVMVIGAWQCAMI